MRDRREMTEKHTSDDSVFFHFCCTILFLITLGIFVMSCYGIQDARAETSTLMA